MGAGSTQIHPNPESQPLWWLAAPEPHLSRLTRATCPARNALRLPPAAYASVGADCRAPAIEARPGWLQPQYCAYRMLVIRAESRALSPTRPRRRARLHILSRRRALEGSHLPAFSHVFLTCKSTLLPCSPPPLRLSFLVLAHTRPPPARMRPRRCRLLRSPSGFSTGNRCIHLHICDIII